MMRIPGELEQRIIAALQVDGRASWRRIAAVLGEPERTVTRHGTELLSRRTVSIVGLRTSPAAALLRLECAPGSSRIAAEALAQRRDTTFSYLMTGEADCIAEILADSQEIGGIIASEIPATVGLTRAISYPILRYFRTIRGWRSGLLGDAQIAALHSELTVDNPYAVVSGPLSAQDEAIVTALIEDGRATIEAIARRAGVSDTTARRRTEWLLRNRVVQIRAVVEPATLGLGIEAILWIRAAPGRVDRVGRALSARREVRYAAAIAGDFQLMANVTVADTDGLYRFLTESAWTADVNSVDTTLVLQARKRGGRVIRADA